MASIWRDPVILVFVDQDNHELMRMTNPAFVPRAAENVRLAGTAYVVERIGYDVPAAVVERIWVVCRPA